MPGRTIQGSMPQLRSEWGTQMRTYPEFVIDNAALRTVDAASAHTYRSHWGDQSTRSFILYLESGTYRRTKAGLRDLGFICW